MAGTLRIQKQSITEMDVDCIVNAANSQLRHGGGVCGAIFAAAGARELQAACDALGHCPTGEAVITPGFKLKAKYIVHAVGPIWQGGNHKEEKLLYRCYQNAMKVACTKGCRSIAFPLISSGIYGYPVKEAFVDSVLMRLDISEIGIGTAEKSNASRCSAVSENGSFLIFF